MAISIVIATRQGRVTTRPYSPFSRPITPHYRSTMDPLFKQIMILIALAVAIILLLVVYIIARTNGA
ncbi:MAG: hypothetical protein U0232_11175 [Thermomicrobiales bacterium]